MGLLFPLLLGLFCIYKKIIQEYFCCCKRKAVVSVSVTIEGSVTSILGMRSEGGCYYISEGWQVVL